MKSPIGKGRFSLASLLVFVCVFAVVCAWVKDKHIGLSGTAFVLNLFVLLWALLKALFERRGKKEFWIGSAALGWPFYVIVSILEESVTRTAVAQNLFLWIYRSPFGGWMSVDRFRALHDFAKIGVLVSTLVVGLLGGVLSQRLFRRFAGASPSETKNLNRTSLSE